ncbi:MAG: polysaccharide deacetylase family protein [Oscillospiraceae bacterium]|nr:polysaccharide deacetylase family protein [Oscillospiraceae bacterium]
MTDWTQHYKRAVTFSYDDGNEQDLRLLEILRQYGLRCTFNLNSGLGGDAGTWEYEGALVRRMVLSERIGCYAGHEIAVHGAKHLNMTELSDAALHEEIVSDRDTLASLCGTVPVGAAYPYGAYDARVMEAMRAAGIRYVRTVNSTHSFAPQEALLAFHPTCHHDDPALETLVEDFLRLEPETPQVLYIWGHSYEFDGHRNWDRFERICERLAGHPDIFYGTNAQVLLRGEM